MSDPQGKIIAVCGRSGAGKSEVARFIHEELRRTAQLGFADPLKELCSFVFDFPADNLWGASYKRNEVFPAFSDSAEWAIAKDRLTRYAPGWTARVLVSYQGHPTQTTLLVKVIDWFNALQAECVGSAGLTPRRTLQTLGTECGRAVDPNIWVDYGLHRARAFLSDDLKAVSFADLRFNNECEVVRAVGGEVWIIERPVFEEGGLTGTAAMHSSESEVYSDEMRAMSTATIQNVGTLDDLHDKVAKELQRVYR